jgi:hypothetical protein
MNRNLKIGLSLLIIASVVFLSSTIAFFVLKEAEAEKREYIERELKDVLRAKGDLSKEISELKASNRELENRLSSAKDQARSISEEIAREKEARRMLSMQLEEEKKKSDGLMADIMREKEERLTLVHQLAKAEESYRQMKEQFNMMLQAKETLEEKLKDMMAKKGVELERIEVRSDYVPGYEEPAAPEPRDMITEAAETEPAPAATAPARPVKPAKVLVVNRKFSFVVANLGKEEGGTIGTELDIYRDGELIAKTKIEKLYDKMSAATILPEWKRARIREGDEVRISR